MQLPGLFGSENTGTATNAFAIDLFDEIGLNVSRGMMIWNFHCLYSLNETAEGYSTSEEQVH